MRALEPAFDYELHARNQEREANSATYHLWVSETFEVRIFDKIFQVEVDANLTRQGEHGNLEWVNCRYTQIHVGLPQFGNPLKLDEQNLREDHAILWNQLEMDVDLLVMRFASKSKSWEVA